MDGGSGGGRICPSASAFSLISGGSEVCGPSWVGDIDGQVCRLSWTGDGGVCGLSGSWIDGFAL